MVVDVDVVAPAVVGVVAVIAVVVTKIRDNQL
jgi:hypothetical protein